MNDHPLGDLTGDTAVPVAPTITDLPSIADTILNLDKFLSGDVRRAEKTSTFCIRPDLEADIDALEHELETLTDSMGRPRAVIDQAVGDASRSAHTVALEIEEKRREYAAAMRSIRWRAMDEDAWAAFQTEWKKAFDEQDFPPEFWEDLLSRTAVAPMFTVAQVREFRSRVGHAIYSDVANTAFRANNASGVSIPKSLLSSVVLRG